jgi:hypothetical protein
MIREQRTEQIKKSYRSKQHPSFEEREDIKARAYLFTNQVKLSRVFKTSPQNISAAFSGNNTGLFNKIKNYVINYELRTQKEVA